MNLHGIVTPAISIVNPATAIKIYGSDGYGVTPEHRQVPKYRPAVIAPAQIQELTAKEIEHLDAMNIQGVRNAIYINGSLSGVIRSEKKGGDIIITPDNRIWLVTVVLEQWPDWCKVGVTLQDVGVPDAYNLDLADPKNSQYVLAILGAPR